MSDYPVEPWELRAYVEEDPSREYAQADTENCIIARYCNERLGGRWSQAYSTLVCLDGRDGQGHYRAPEWAKELVGRFDTMFLHQRAGGVTGKQILEADILPRGDA